MTTETGKEGGEMLGRRHGSERFGNARPSTAVESPAERAAQVAERAGQIEERQPTAMPVKLYRSDDLVTVAAPMPGLGSGDIAVVVSPERRLVIVGRLCADPDTTCGTLKQPQKQVLLDEWEVGPYRREIDLPTDVDGQAATVTYGNGILVVALPVAEKTTPARLMLENVSSHLRAGRVGRRNRRIGGTPTNGATESMRRGAALVAGGTAALYLLRRGATRRGLAALATGSVAPAILARVWRATRQRRAVAGARKPVSPRASENPVDEASWESFPASDPPSWAGSRIT